MPDDSNQEMVSYLLPVKLYNMFHFAKQKHYMMYRRLHQFINICDLECGRKLPTTEFDHLVLFFKFVCTDFENCGSEIQVYICVVIHKLYGYINHHLSIVNTFPLPHINHLYFNYH